MTRPRPSARSARLNCEPLEDRLAPAAGALQISAITSRVLESPYGPVIAVTVIRTGGADGAVSVAVTTGGTATPGADFAAGPFTVSLADGQTDATLTVPVLDDALAEPTETVTFALAGPTGGATLGATTTGAARIEDDDATLAVLAAAPPGAGQTEVRVFTASAAFLPNPLPAALRASFVPFAGFRGAVSAALADLNGDGVRDVVAGAAANGHVKVLDGRTGGELRSFLAYPGFGGGVRVAAGDVTGDGVADVITGAGSNAHVKVFDGRTGAEVRSFLAFPGFAGAVDVAAGDVDGDGFADVVAGAGANGHVKVFDGRTGAEVRSLRPYPASYTGGVLVAAADLNGDGRADVVTGCTVGGIVTAFDGPTGAAFLSPSYSGGVDSSLQDVAAADADEDGLADVLTGFRNDTRATVGRSSGLTGRFIPNLADSLPHTILNPTFFDVSVG